MFFGDKISTGTFTVTFRANPDGSVDYTVTRPNLCCGSGRDRSLLAFLERVAQIHAEESRLYGEPKER